MSEQSECARSYEPTEVVLRAADTAAIMQALNMAAQTLNMPGMFRRGHYEWLWLMLANSTEIRLKMDKATAVRVGTEAGDA